MNTFFDNPEDYAKLSGDSKIALVATIDEKGYPHITFLSSLQPLGKDKLTFGVFCEGLSKKFIKERGKVGFLFFTKDLEFWTGRADFTHVETSGPEFEMYNNKPLFRYNSYFGIGWVYYLNVKDAGEKNTLTMSKIISGALRTRALAAFSVKGGKGALPPLAKKMFGDIGGLKFVSYVDADGYPVIVPAIQAAPAGTDRIVFAKGPLASELKKIPDKVKASVLYVSLKMNSVLAKGIYKNRLGAGAVDVESVYNSMPPFPGYIYPEQPITKVTEF